MREITAPPTERAFKGSVSKAVLHLDDPGNPQVELRVDYSGGLDDLGTSAPLFMNPKALDAFTRDLLSLNEQVQEIVRAHKRETGDGSGRPASP